MSQMLPRMFTIINFDWWLKVFLFLAPIVWLPGIPQNSLQMIVFDYGTLMLFGLSLALPAKREFKNYNILIILSVCIIVSLINNFRAYPVNLIHLVSGLLLYVAIVRSVVDIRGAIKVLIISAGINLLFFFLQYLGVNIIYTKDNLYLLTNPGLMGRNYHLAYFLSFLIPFMLSYGKKGICLAIISTVVILMLKSYACVFSLFAGLIIFLIFKYRKHIRNSKLIIGILSIPLILGLLLLAVNKNTIVNKIRARSSAIMYLVNESLVNPFVGRGLGSFEIDANLFTDDKPKFDSSFNQYLRLMYEIGVLPFLLIVWGMFKYFKGIVLFEPSFMGSLAAIAVFPMFHEVLRFARFSILIVAMIALYEAYCLNKNKEVVI